MRVLVCSVAGEVFEEQLDQHFKQMKEKSAAFATCEVKKYQLLDILKAVIIIFGCRH